MTQTEFADQTTPQTLRADAAPLGRAANPPAAINSARKGRAWWSGQTPILPAAGATGAPMTIVIAIISALAALSLAAFVLIASASAKWTSDLAASMTVQIKGASQEEIAANTTAAVNVLETTAGVTEISVKSSSQAAKLLEPWLGANADSYLSVPALIEMRAAPSARENLAALRTRLSAIGDGVVLDDHGGWNTSLIRASRTGQLLAFTIFLLITGAACTIAAFAARAGLAANADVVSLLHLVGATDEFIANEVQRRFVLVGLKGAGLGLALALVMLFLASLSARSYGAGAYFLPVLDFDMSLIAPMAMMPVAISIATAMSARFTVLRTLRLKI